MSNSVEWIKSENDSVLVKFVDIKPWYSWHKGQKIKHGGPGRIYRYPKNEIWNKLLEKSADE